MAPKNYTKRNEALGALQQPRETHAVEPYRAQAQAYQDAAPMPGGEALVASGATIQRTSTPFVTAVAVQRPRDRRLVLSEVMGELEWKPEAAYYSWTTSNKDGSRGVVEGPSIKLAMSIAREWGNCSTYAVLEADEGAHWRFAGHFVDLERGFVSTRTFRQRKPAGGMGRMDAERTEDIAYQVGQSKAIRNAIVNGIPEGLIAQAIQHAKSLTGKRLTSGGTAQSLERTLAAFGKLGVSRAQLEARCDAPAAKWTAEHYGELRGLWNALEEGQTSVANEFGGNDKQATEAMRDAIMGGAAKPEKPAPPEPKDSVDDDNLPDGF